MAGNAVIGSLRVNLGMDSAEFQNGAKRAQSTLGTLGAGIKAFAAGAVAALSFGAITSSIRAAVDHMDEMGKAAQKIGIPVEQLSGLEYAARLADVSLEGLSSNLSKFNRSLAEIAGGGKNDAGAALNAIGVSALDANGKLRPTAELIADIAGKFGGYSDGAEKAALAQALFGKAGADMIPLLNGGRDAIAGATEEARRFGIVTNEEAARAAEDFNDNLTRLKAAGEGLSQIVAGALIQSLADLSGKIIEYIDLGSNAERITNAIRVMFNNLVAIVRETSAEFQKMSLIYGYVMDFFTSGTKASLDPAGAWTDLKAKIAAINAELETANRYSQQFVNSYGKGSLPGTSGSGGGGGKPPAPVLPPATLKGGGTATKPPAKEVQEVTKSLYDMDLALGEVRTTAQDTSNAFAETIGNQMQSWIDSALNGTFDLKDALKDLLSSLAKVGINSVFQALAGGGAAGGQSFLGGLFGFASGGTIMPGGTGGIDSQLVAFRKSPNERVDITKPGQTLSSGGGAMTVNINAPNSDRQGLAVLAQEVRNLRKNFNKGAISAYQREAAANPGFRG